MDKLGVYEIDVARLTIRLKLSGKFFCGTSSCLACFLSIIVPTQESKYL